MALDETGTIEEGDPEMIRAEADELKTVAANIHTVAEMLRMVSTKGVWESCSGTLFEQEVGTTPQDLVAIANRLSDTEQIIRPYADRLEKSQAELARLRARYDANDRTSEDRRARLETMTPEDPEYATVDREYRAASNSREMNKRGYRRVADAAVADERATAGRLGSVGAALSDPRTYNSFEMASRTGTSSLFNNPVVDVTPWGKPAAIMTAGDPIGKLGRRAVYGEGSYKDVGATTVLTAVDIVIPGSKRADAKNATRLSHRADELKNIRAADTSTNPIAHRRIAANAKSWTKHKVATNTVKLKHRATDKLAEASGARLVDDMVTDWAAVAGSGRVRKGGYVVKYSVRTTSKVTSQASSVTSTAGRIEQATESPADRRARREKEEAAQRRQLAEQQRRDERVHDLSAGPLHEPAVTLVR